MGRLSLLLAAAVLTCACARRTEVIGRLLGDAGFDMETGGTSDAGAPDRIDAPIAETGVSDAGDSAVPFGCLSDPQPPPISEPQWNCGRFCLQLPDVDPAQFEGRPVDQDPTHQPVLVYPLEGSVHPLYLPGVTFQWKRQNGDAQRSFLIKMLGSGGDLFRFYVPYQPPAPIPLPPGEPNVIYEVPPAVWRYIGFRQRGAEVTVTITALDTAAGTVAISRPFKLAFSPAPIQAGLYYLSLGDHGIHRHVFGTSSAELLVPMGSAASPRGCAGCHSLSRNGGIIAFSSTLAGDLAIAATDRLDNPVQPPPAPPAPDSSDGYAPAVSPDGQYVLARDKAGTVTVLDLMSTPPGQPVSVRTAAQLNGRLDYPEFSVDGTKVVSGRASLDGMHPQAYSAYDGEIVELTFDRGTLGLNPVVLASNPNELYSHPSWSPDGQWIVFVARAKGAENYKGGQPGLRLLRRSDRNIFVLGKASQSERDLATYPKFAPVQQDKCRLAFIVFQSHMDYGFLAANSTVGGNPVPNLWLAAIDLSLPTLDPSRAPVWLPFQRLNVSNLLPAWSERVPCAPASAGCGTGGQCQGGRCVAVFQ